MKKRKSDITAKILTLVIAIFLWNYVMSEENPDQTQEYRNISVNYTNAAALDRQGLVIMGPEEVMINVKVGGKRSDMSKFSAASIYAQADLSGYSEGNQKIPITVGLLDQSSGIRIINHEPKEALFTFERIISKEIPVQVSYLGELPDNYVLGDSLSRPQSILINGPRSWVNEVTEAQPLVDITDKTENTTISTPVKIINDDGEEIRGVEKNPGFVDVTLAVFRTVELPVELATINDLPENYAITDIEINPERVRVKGDNSVAQLAQINTVEIDINTMLESETIEVELDLPEGVTLLEAGQKITVSYKVREIVTKSVEFTLADVMAMNLGDNLEVSPETEAQTFTVEISGYDMDIDEITLEDLKFFIDLEGLNPGDHQVEIEWEEIEGLSIGNLQPPVVQIIIIDA